MLSAHETGGDRKASAQRLPAGDEVGDVAAPPEGTRSSEPRVDLIRNQKRAGLVAALAQTFKEAVGRNLGSRAALHGLDDDARRVGRERSGILSVRAAVHGSGQPGRERAPELLEPRSGEGEQPELSPEDEEKLLDFARCMREHGIDMPDPGEGGMLFRVGGPGDADAIDPEEFEAAQEACQDLLPGRLDGDGPGFRIGPGGGSDGGVTTAPDEESK